MIRFNKPVYHMIWYDMISPSLLHSSLLFLHSLSFSLSFSLSLTLSLSLALLIALNFSFSVTHNPFFSPSFFHIYHPLFLSYSFMQAWTAASLALVKWIMKISIQERQRLLPCKHSYAVIMDSLLPTRTIMIIIVHMEMIIVLIHFSLRTISTCHPVKQPPWKDKN